MTRVLEIGHYAAGYAGRLFVRAGFDVVRMEGQSQPAWASREAMNIYLHAGKRRVDTWSHLEKMAAAADIVICEASSADEVDSLGFDAWPCDIKVAITPFGRTGPKRNWHASANVILAMGGYTFLMGDEGRQPLSLPGHYLEFQTGAVAYASAAASLFAQRQSVADIAMLETLMSLSQFTTVMWHCAGEVRARHGSDFWTVAPSDLFRLRDGWVYVSIVPAFWDPFIALLATPELVIDERFQTNDGRREHRLELREIIARAFAELSRADIEVRAETYRVPMGVVRTMDDVLAEAHLQMRGFWESLTAASGEVVRSPGLPFNFDDRERRAYETSEVEQ